ncbi:MAG: oxidoreductase, partial [Nitrospira sp.]|nr:oxidoreductase [Nitrospira sp.]
MGDAEHENGYAITLIERRLVAEGTMAFYFDKPPQ